MDTEQKDKITHNLKAELAKSVKNSLLDDIDWEDIKAKLSGVLKKAKLVSPTSESTHFAEVFAKTLQPMLESALKIRHLGYEKPINNSASEAISEQVVPLLVWMDYYIKGTYVHNLINTRKVQGNACKTSILLGDLYNFKAMQMASRLTPEKFKFVTNIQEMLAKMHFTCVGDSRKISSKVSHDEAVYSLYYNMLRAVGASRLGLSKAGMSALAGEISRLHPADGLLASQTKES